MMTCENCAGDGWIRCPYTTCDGEETEIAYQCPECNGSGWLEGEPEPLDIEDLDLRAPIESLLRWWSCLAARDAWPEQRARLAGVCDRRVTWQYRISEC